MFYAHKSRRQLEPYVILSTLEIGGCPLGERRELLYFWHMAALPPGEKEQEEIPRREETRYQMDPENVEESEKEGKRFLVESSSTQEVFIDRHIQGGQGGWN